MSCMHVRRHAPWPPCPPAHAQPATGCALVEGLVVAAGERVLVKTRFSAFFATNLDLVLR